MNATDILKYGHTTVLDSVQGLPPEQWRTPGVCGVWSAKDVIAHLVSYEWVLTEILQGQAGGGATPYLDEYVAPGGNFNDRQVEIRADTDVEALLTEFETAHRMVMDVLATIPTKRLSETGTLPWYGSEYSLDDVIVYMYYGHAREHSAQIAAFRDREQL